MSSSFFKYYKSFTMLEFTFNQPFYNIYIIASDSDNLFCSYIFFNYLDNIDVKNDSYSSSDIEFFFFSLDLISSRLELILRLITFLQ